MRTPRVLREFRDLLETSHALADACLGISALLKAGLDRTEADGALRERVEGLEASRALWEAEMDALMLKADSTLKAANNAESRTRTMKKSYEKLLDPFDADSEEVEAADFRGYAPVSEEEGVQPVRVGVETNNKAQAMRAKFL